jgi:hypothetical protein
VWSWDSRRIAMMVRGISQYAKDVKLPSILSCIYVRNVGDASNPENPWEGRDNDKPRLSV